ncbi:MAG: hypothetical protein R2791_13405 [Saprospiraceae bacterium]|nr:DUF4332 domain-containing protein [Saprospiraceae bacterium]
MVLSYIFLHDTTFMQDLPTGLMLCIIPFILGWLAASAYYKVGALKTELAELRAKVDSLTGENTELRLKLSQTEADVESKSGQLHKAKDDLMMCESERNALREQLGDKHHGGGGGHKGHAITFNGKRYKHDDLKIVEGIGPKISDLLHAAGIKTWKQLSEAAPDKLKEILDGGGSQFNIHDPGTWPAQARLANNGEWDALKKLQDELSGGKV